MAFSKKDPITVRHLFSNILARTGDIGKAVRICFVEGTVVGTPNAPADLKGFRNLMHKAIALVPDDRRPTLNVYMNTSEVKPGFVPGSHEEIQKAINSLFVIVDTGTEQKVCVNLVVFDLPDSATATATPTPTEGL